MSDSVREAFEALNKYRKAYDEIYQMLGMFLDADEGLGKPDIDEAWAAFNLAPGPVYWKAIEAALSTNGGEAVAELDRAAIEEAMVEGGWWKPCTGCHETVDGQTIGSGRRTVFGCEAGGGCDECGGIGVIWEEAPTDEQLALLSADPDTHPAPPSVAVPEGWKLVPIEPTTEMRAAFHDANEEWEDGGLYSPDHQWCAMLTAAPSPDHSGDANKMVTPSVPENEIKARVVSGARDMLRESGKQFRAIGDIGHAAMCENHVDELDRLRTAGEEEEGV